MILLVTVVAFMYEGDIGRWGVEEPEIKEVEMGFINRPPDGCYCPLVLWVGQVDKLERNARGFAGPKRS